MYCEVTITRNTVLLGGRAYTSRQKAVAGLRAFLAEPKGLFPGWKGRKVSFRTWEGQDRTRVRIDSYPAED